MLEDEQTTADIINKVSSKPTIKKKTEIKKITVHVCLDVFRSQNKETLKPIIGEPMKIHLREDAVPFAIAVAWQISFALRDQVREEIKAWSSG